MSQPLYNYDFIDPPVGINIELTPHITKSESNTSERRTIGLEIDQIQASNFIEFTDFNAPITEDRTFSGYIDILDGQQIVVGGMIKSKQTEVENKVPFLGDIPLIGRRQPVSNPQHRRAFRSTSIHRWKLCSLYHELPRRRKYLAIQES